MGNFAFLCPKFSDSEDQRYCDISCDIFLRSECVCQVSFAYETSLNQRNCHGKNLRLDMENTGNLKIKFEWETCLIQR